jgi:hypothetical protein
MKEFVIHMDDPPEAWERLYRSIEENPGSFDPQLARAAEERRKASVARRLWLNTPDIPAVQRDR